MKVENAKVMTLGERFSGPQGHRYITLELEFGVDMVTSGQFNLVPACDWFSTDLTGTVNGRFMEFDISQIVQNGGMKALQSVYIDNGPNSCAMTLEVMSTKQRVTCPPGHQGWFPLLCAVKDGRFRLGALDKDNNRGNNQPSWILPASITGSGFSVQYKPCFIFTDQPVPPAVWDVRQKSSTLVVLGKVFSTTSPEALTSGPSQRRMGLGFRARWDNFGTIFLEKFNVGGLVISQNFWELFPGESLRFEGDSTPVDQFFGTAQFTTDALYVYTLI